MAHLGMGTMFGMTLLGDPQTFLHTQRRPFSGSIKDVPKEIYLKLFIEKGRFHNNEDEVRRAILPQIFTDAIGRQLNASEVDLMLRYFHFKPGNMTYEEFERAIDDMKANRAVSPPPIITKVVKSLKGKGPPRQKILNSEIEDMKHKHRRDPFGPTDMLTRPLTTNMEYGWETMLYPGDSSIPNSEKKTYFPKGGTDVTQARGMQVKNEKFIGERGEYHVRPTLPRPGTSNGTSGFGDIHRRPGTSNGTSGFADIHRRPRTAPIRTCTGPVHLHHLQSSIPRREVNKNCPVVRERNG